MKNIRAWLCAIAFALTGCASNVTLSPGASGSSEGLSQDEGAVAFRVTTTTLGLNQFFAYWDIVEVGKVKAGNDLLKYHVTYERAGALGSATYFGKLKPGRYYLSKFESTQCGAWCVSSSLGFPFEEFQFTVTQGQVTYLGELIHQAQLGRGSRLVAPATINTQEFKDWLEGFRPDLATYPVVAQPLAPIANDAVYQTTFATGVGLFHPTAVSADAVLFSGRAGGLRLLDRGGIRNIAPPGPATLHALLPLTDRQWLVGGDFKALRQTDDAGRTWRDLKASVPYGAIRGLYRNARGQTVVVIERPNEILVYAGDLAADTWTRVFAQKYVFDFWRGTMRSPLVERTGRELLLALPDGKGALVDIDSQQADLFEFPGGTMSAAFTADGALRCRCNKSGLWVNPWISRDRGKTWVEDTIDRGMPLPVYRDARFAITTRGTEVVTSRDGGATWDAVYKVENPYMPSPLLPFSMSFTFLGADKVIATDGVSNVIRSEDGGRTWQRDWPRAKQ